VEKAGFPGLGQSQLQKYITDPYVTLQCVSSRLNHHCPNTHEMFYSCLKETALPRLPDPYSFAHT
jgi:hypothetical protein